jgi:hypothetical protein
MSNSKIRYMPLWADYLDLFLDEELSDEEVGQLLRIMLRFYYQGEEPKSIPKALKCCWVLLKNNLLQAKESYLIAVENGRKGGRPKKVKPTETQQNPEVTQPNPKKPIQEQEHKQEQEQEQKQEHNKNIDTRCSPPSEGFAQGSKNLPKSFGEFGWVKLTETQHQKLSSLMGNQELEACIRYVDELTQSTQNVNRWKDWNLILRRCYRDRWHKEATHRRNNPVPEVSGQLGAAELEAIQRVLQEN